VRRTTSARSEASTASSLGRAASSAASCAATPLGRSDGGAVMPERRAEGGGRRAEGGGRRAEGEGRRAKGAGRRAEGGGRRAEGGGRRAEGRTDGRRQRSCELRRSEACTCACGSGCVTGDTSHWYLPSPSSSVEVHRQTTQSIPLPQCSIWRDGSPRLQTSPPAVSGVSGVVQCGRGVYLDEVHGRQQRHRLHERRHGERDALPEGVGEYCWCVLLEAWDSEGEGLTCMERHTPPSFTRSSIAPAVTQGTISRKHGQEPSSICGSRSFRMPVSTEVGQSGPPQRMHTWGATAGATGVRARSEDEHLAERQQA
jgi:hypothetical protein